MLSAFALFNGTSRDKLPVLDYITRTTMSKPTSRRAMVSGPTRPTTLTNPRLVANPSHQHKRLLNYCRCRYFHICPLLTYCCPRYIFFAQDGRRKGCMPEAKMIQNRPFIRVSRYGHSRTEWTSEKDFIYPKNQSARFYNLRKKSWKNQLSYMKMLNICAT